MLFCVGYVATIVHLNVILPPELFRQAVGDAPLIATIVQGGNVIYYTLKVVVYPWIFTIYSHVDELSLMAFAVLVFLCVLALWVAGMVFGEKRGLAGFSKRTWKGLTSKYPVLHYFSLPFRHGLALSLFLLSVVVLANLWLYLANFDDPANLLANDLYFPAALEQERLLSSEQCRAIRGAFCPDGMGDKIYQLRAQVFFLLLALLWFCWLLVRHSDVLLPLRAFLIHGSIVLGMFATLFLLPSYYGLLIASKDLPWVVVYTGTAPQASSLLLFVETQEYYAVWDSENRRAIVYPWSEVKHLDVLGVRHISRAKDEWGAFCANRCQ